MTPASPLSNPEAGPAQQPQRLDSHPLAGRPRTALGATLPPDLPPSLASHRNCTHTSTAASMPAEQIPPVGLDAATLQLERLVEETHQALMRDGLIQVGDPAGGAGVPAIPSLDAVDKALEELQRGLAEIDSAIAAPA